MELVGLMQGIPARVNELLERTTILLEETRGLATIVLGLDMLIKEKEGGEGRDWAPVDVVEALPWNGSARWPFPTRQGRAQRKVEEIRYVTLHHSAGSRATTSIVGWNTLHTMRKGWSHVGYHFGVGSLEPGGEVGAFQLNRLGEFTWHDSRNSDTVGVCLAGWLEEGHDDAPTDEQADLCGRLLAWLVPQLPNLKAIVGHQHWQSTKCPGELWRWGKSLVDAAARHGGEIGPLLEVRPRQRMRATTMKLGRVVGPPLGDYEGV